MTLSKYKSKKKMFNKGMSPKAMPPTEQSKSTLDHQQHRYNPLLPIEYIHLEVSKEILAELKKLNEKLK